MCASLAFAYTRFTQSRMCVLFYNFTSVEIPLQWYIFTAGNGLKVHKGLRIMLELKKRKNKLSTV